MKKTLVITLLIITTILSGCSKISSNSELKKAKEELENHNYDVALNILSEIINDDPNNNEARAMYMQSIKMPKALKYKQDGYYAKAIEELDYIVNINDGSNVIKRESVNLKSELEKLQAEEEGAFIKGKEDAKQSSKKYIQNAEYNLRLEAEKRRKEEEKMKENMPSTDDENLSNDNSLNSSESIEKNEINSLMQNNNNHNINDLNQ